MYKRPNLYPDGRVIPIVLPDSYRMTNTEGAPIGQQCDNCKMFNQGTRQCKHWYDAFVWPMYWCAAWTTK